MTDKWSCTTFVVECKKETMRWIDQWNPWALRREIEKQEIVIAELHDKLDLCNTRSAERVERNVELRKRIEELESELRGKQSECDLHEECAKFNSTKLGLAQAEITAAIELLQGIIKGEEIG